MAQANNALNTSLNSSGSAYQEQERYMDSMQAKTEQFKAAFQSLSDTALNSDLLKFFIDLGTTGVKAFDSLIKAISPLGTIGLGIGLFTGIKNDGKHRMSIRISNY